MSKKKHDRRPTERVHQNPVTHEVERVQLDDVQKAFDNCVRYIEGRMLEFGSDAAALAKGYRLAEMLLERIARMKPHAGGHGHDFGNGPCAPKKAG